MHWRYIQIKTDYFRLHPDPKATHRIVVFHSCLGREAGTKYLSGAAAFMPLRCQRKFLESLASISSKLNEILVKSICQSGQAEGT